MLEEQRKHRLICRKTVLMTRLVWISSVVVLNEIPCAFAKGHCAFRVNLSSKSNRRNNVWHVKHVVKTRPDQTRLNASLWFQLMATGKSPNACANSLDLNSPRFSVLFGSINFTSNALNLRFFTKLTRDFDLATHACNAQDLRFRVLLSLHFPSIVFIGFTCMSAGAVTKYKKSLWHHPSFVAFPHSVSIWPPSGTRFQASEIASNRWGSRRSSRTRESPIFDPWRLNLIEPMCRKLQNIEVFYGDWIILDILWSENVES
ncbi:hypothetical protein FB451DRAFT_1170631 [Mycena latifolia]|nr:hypothetical protein FB451DRAFT_1170631 [Mycena latifolia]